jgi:opacity protein-like surface antigen
MMVSPSSSVAFKQDTIFRAGHLLFGVEGDFDWATFSHPALPTQTLGSVNQNWIGTVAGRIGLVEDRWLIYGKVGGGWVHSNAILNFPGVSWSGSNTSSGWLIGAGLEYGFKSHWTVRLEYDFLSLANWASPTLPSIQLNRDVQMIKAGINYKFDAGLPDPSCTGETHGQFRQACRRGRPRQAIAEPHR